jgi:peroxidase
MAHRRAAFLLAVALTVLGLATTQAQLQNGFYKGKCGANDVEAIVQGVVKARFSREPAVVAHLLRLQFHECGVNVCTPSITCKSSEIFQFF